MPATGMDSAGVMEVTVTPSTPEAAAGSARAASAEAPAASAAAWSATNAVTVTCDIRGARTGARILSQLGSFARITGEASGHEGELFIRGAAHARCTPAAAACDGSYAMIRRP